MTTKNTNNNKTTNTTTSNNQEVQTFESESYTRDRPVRRKVYERIRETDIPAYVKEKFAKQGYELRFVRWSIHGQPDYRYLHRREKEGYEFVDKSELPEEYLRTMRTVDTNIANGLITNGGDLCLMKVDTDLRRSRTEYFDGITDGEVAAVDIHVMGKKGFITKGSKSNVIMKEPSFQE